MQTFFVQSYYKFITFKAGLKKHIVYLDEKKTIYFSYSEKGQKITGIPTIVFVHGISSNKETFIPIVQHIPDTYHTICVDLPGHGETQVPCEDGYSIDKFADHLKSFFDALHLHEPMCLIGASMGGAVVCVFVSKYPEYVSSICLLAPIADQESETQLIEKLRSGDSTALLPETPDQLQNMLQTLTVKRIRVPRFFLNGLMHIRSRLLGEHKKILEYLLNEEANKVQQYFDGLKNIHCSTLVLWGKDDKVYAVSGASYYTRRIPRSRAVILDDCGHFLAIDKPVETAGFILNFFQNDDIPLRDNLPSIELHVPNDY